MSQVQIINRLIRLQLGIQSVADSDLPDLSVVRQISHRVLVLYLGRAMEIASRDDLDETAHQPYTQALISAVPIPSPDREGTSRP